MILGKMYELGYILLRLFAQIRSMRLRTMLGTGERDT